MYNICIRLSEGEKKEKGKEDMTKTPNHKSKKFREY